MEINAKATQEFVPIKEVRDGTIILKDNSLRAIIMASSINFALKGADERNAILYQFQVFLNSLDFPVQIVVQSRELDIRPYLALLEQREKSQVNELMKIQIEEYIGFIKDFTENTNVMTKNFFVVVSYTPAVLQGKINKGMLSGLFGKKEKKEDIKRGQEESFEENRTQLEQRIAVVEQGLVRCGIRIARLGTEEVTEIFYRVFNPGESEKSIKLG
ncbi:MAG: hypothetical protein AAB534_03360 [Patescibacteria group bacterium]